VVHKQIDEEVDEWNRVGEKIKKTEGERKLKNEDFFFTKRNGSVKGIRFRGGKREVMRPRMQSQLLKETGKTTRLKKNGG